MKTRIYLMSALCALYITTAQAWTILGYDVTSWAIRVFNAVRSYFVPTAQPPDPVDIARKIALMKAQSSSKIFYPFNDLYNPPLTQTKQHLIVNFDSKYAQLKRGGSIDYACCPELQEMTKEVIRLEAQEQAKGRYTFVHGYAWRYHFFHEIYNDLWNIANNEYIPTYRAIRPTYPLKSTWEEFITYIIEQEKMREKLITQTDQGNHPWPQCTYNLLFMNYALFAHKHLDENTAYYIKNNQSLINRPLRSLDFFKELHIIQYFSDAQISTIIKQLTELQAEHKMLSQYGGGLLLSFTPEALHKAVYPAGPRGLKDNAIIIDKEGRYTTTNNPELILNTLRSAPETIQNSDDLLFVCVLSHDCTLIPNNGLDIYEFNAADQGKLAAWRAKKDELMQQIKTIVDEKRAKQQAQQIKSRL